MSTLILTSAGFKTPILQKELLKILPRKPADLSLSYITTASKTERKKDYVDRDRSILLNLGFKVKEVDIEGKSARTLAGELKDFQLLYVQGGNTFFLLKCVRESGFGGVVRKMLNQGVIYIGVSAGSYIACPTIEMSTWKKTHQKRPRFGLKNLEALGLVPFLLTVHYKEEYREDVRRGVMSSRYPVRILTDDQALVVKNGKVRLIGDGDEVKL